MNNKEKLQIINDVFVGVGSLEKFLEWKQLGEKDAELLTDLENIFQKFGLSFLKVVTLIELEAAGYELIGLKNKYMLRMMKENERF